MIDVQKESVESWQKVRMLKVKSPRENSLQEELANIGKLNCF